MTIRTERLPGCNSETLDSYLRGVGFFLLVGDVEPAVRAWWDEDGVLWFGCPSTLDELVALAVAKVRRDPPPLRTPWRGKGGRDLGFVDTRNGATDFDLDWFDACALARPVQMTGTPAGARELSNRMDNPLLGQGGAFGNVKSEDAYRDAIERIEKLSDEETASGLLAAIRGQPLEQRLAKKISVEKKVLGAYQSGRGTGPGASSQDRKATDQKARTSAWDILLVLNGLRAFRGSLARRPDPGAREQASFPLVVQSQPIGTGPGGIHELRSDVKNVNGRRIEPFEFLAPLWSTPCTSRPLRKLVWSARVRLPRAVAHDTLDAILVQASCGAQGLGFDRLVRFALILGQDPTKPARFAVRRGEIHALGQAAARLAVDEILPFLRDLEREVAHTGAGEAPAIAIARRRLDDALASFARPASSPGGTTSEAASAQEALMALAALQTPAAWTIESDRALEPPRLSSRWFRSADDGSPVFRLARSLLAGLSDDRATLVRETLLPQRRDDDRFLLDPARTPTDLERVSDPLAVLVHLILTALRRARPRDLPRAGSTSVGDLAVLLSGSLGREEERRLALLCAALADVHPSELSAARPGDPLRFGIGADVARLLLAAQPAAGVSSAASATRADKARADTLEPMTTLASLLLAGRVDVARRVADRELRRRGLDLLPLPPRPAPSPRPAALALAVLLPFDEQARSPLERACSVLPVATTGGSS